MLVRKYDPRMARAVMITQFAIRAWFDLASPDNWLRIEVRPIVNPAVMRIVLSVIVHKDEIVA